VSRATLLGVIGAAALLVTLLAVLTPTVIVDDSDPQAGVVRVAVAPSPLPPRRLAPTVPGVPRGLPLLPRTRALRGLRECLRNHGLGRRDRGARPDVQTLRKALRACRGSMPGVPFGG
jgi:hypothetical protein